VALVWSLTKDVNTNQTSKVNMEKQIEQKPFYKKTWFLVVAGFVLLIVITNVIGSFFATSGSTSNQTQVLTPAQKEAQAKAQAEAQATQAKANSEWKASKAGQICQKHTDWAKDDCEKLANNKIWIGETIDMVKYLRGEPNTANPSNYGSGTEWQWCWDDYTPSCFYGGSDGIFTSYN
jgi:hypothetical protein